jgi:hypothetical protein
VVRVKGKALLLFARKEIKIRKTKKRAGNLPGKFTASK